jgi:Arc/MetJ-type ribon-helix-helix transcriptional regulator
MYAPPFEVRELCAGVICQLVIHPLYRRGIATTKITVTLPDRQLTEIRKRVAAQEAPTVSGFIQQAVQKSLENAVDFRAMVGEGLTATGGPPKSRERAWARRMLAARKRGPSRGRPRERLPSG